MGESGAAEGDYSGPGAAHSTHMLRYRFVKRPPISRRSCASVGFSARLNGDRGACGVGCVADGGHVATCRRFHNSSAARAVCGSDGTSRLSPRLPCRDVPSLPQQRKANAVAVALALLSSVLRLLSSESDLPSLPQQRKANAVAVALALLSSVLRLLSSESDLPSLPHRWLRSELGPGVRRGDGRIYTRPAYGWVARAHALRVWFGRPIP